MFNDTSSLKSHLATRRSGKARDMVTPGPDTDELRAIIELALRTPDHGKLAPWRIITIAPEQRDAFAALLKQAWVAENPGAAGMDLSALDPARTSAPHSGCAKATRSSAISLSAPPAPTCRNARVQIMTKSSALGTFSVA